MAAAAADQVAGLGCICGRKHRRGSGECHRCQSCSHHIQGAHDLKCTSTPPPNSPQDFMPNTPAIASLQQQYLAKRAKVTQHLVRTPHPHTPSPNRHLPAPPAAHPAPHHPRYIGSPHNHTTMSHNTFHGRKRPRALEPRSPTAKHLLARAGVAAAALLSLPRVLRAWLRSSTGAWSTALGAARSSTARSRSAAKQLASLVCIELLACP